MGKFYLTIRYLHYFKDKNDAEDISEGQKQLELSQKAWLAYREAQCEGLMGYGYYGSQAQGAGYALIQCSCISEKLE
ncbi:lysozyme inhibitor LprI family protein [Acinetobacter modestus]|uniref:lysozyme inhibitor LprI family protein n=1 Tax=Acinetobacter modestus TaxID=1776740 RepID=UPI001F4A2F1D|nr:lysozyme inhibitor LprI family protein [Acinetobacter modestus]MCH7330240.1 DUF1311 domain-containing protein [Acinetobacter modestus]